MEVEPALHPDGKRFAKRRVGGELDGRPRRERPRRHDNLVVIPGHIPWFGGNIRIHGRALLQPLAECDQAVGVFELDRLDNIMARFV